LVQPPIGAPRRSRRRVERGLQAAPLYRRAAAARSRHFKANVLGALPKRLPAERRQILESRGERDEMIAGELAHLAGEADAYYNYAAALSDWNRLSGKYESYFDGYLKDK